MTFAEFEALYRETFRRLMSYTPKQAGCAIYVEKLAKLSDAYPGWAEIVENKVEEVA